MYQSLEKCRSRRNNNCRPGHKSIGIIIMGYRSAKSQVSLVRKWNEIICCGSGDLKKVSIFIHVKNVLLIIISVHPWNFLLGGKIFLWRKTENLKKQTMWRFKTNGLMLNGTILFLTDSS